MVFSTMLIKVFLMVFAKASTDGDGRATTDSCASTDDSSILMSEHFVSGDPGQSLLQVQSRGTHPAAIPEARSDRSQGDVNKTSALVDLGDYGIPAIPPALLPSLVMINSYKCEFVASEGDELHVNCGKGFDETGINPANLSQGAGKGSPEWRNALRLHLPLGSLPCCATAPFCAAPHCQILQASDQVSAVHSSALESGSKTCTKRSASANYRYMTHPEVYPAYYGWGGSYEVDVQKHWDVLSVIHGFHPRLPPFDLVIDLGANSGLVTEKLVMRRFAEDYIMVEAQPPIREWIFTPRLGNPEWRKHFVAEQTTTWPGAVNFEPSFEWLNYALSNQTGGVLDTFSYQYNLGDWNPEDLNTTAPMAALDSIIPSKLSSDFATRFAQAQSAYVKVDTEGMDQKVLNGMVRLLQERRGDDFLVNFMMLEFCQSCMVRVRETQGLEAYDLRTLAKTLEDLGFEAFIIGPRYLPITHGSWDDDFLTFTQSHESRKCNAKRYPFFQEMFPELFVEGTCLENPDKPDSMVSDIFAMRASHPRAADIKIALGACEESQDFYPSDPQYAREASVESTARTRLGN